MRSPAHSRLVRHPLLLLLLLALLAAAVAGAAVWHDQAAPAKGAAAAGSPHQRCMFVLAGKRATADGSVLMSYNNDWTANTHVPLEIVPATSTTYGFVKLNASGNYPEGGINTRQFAACYGVATDLNPVAEAADPYPNKGVGKDMWDQLLAKSATCRQALDLLAQWGGTIGFSGDAAGSFGMIDENEAWAVEVLNGHHWAAARVPDTMYYAQPNMPRIRQVNLSDTNNFRGSADLVTFAQSLGLYDPSQGPFDVAWAYGNRDDLQNWYNTNRLWGAAHVLSSSRTFDVSMPYATRPVFMSADTKLTVSGIIAVNRYHYEGTALDQTNGYTTMTPHAMTDRPICCAWNDYSAVFQARSWLPDGVGGVLWFAPSRACSSGLTPFYDSITSVPSVWANKTAFGAFKAVADSLDKQGTVGGELRYKHYIGLVRSTYDGFFNATLAQAAGVESTAASLWSTNQAQAIANLTAFSGERATTAYNLANGLPAQMP
jgi:dipeptidase